MPDDNNVVVLIVEDDFVDATLIKKKIKERNLPYKTRETLDGREAIEYLRNNRATDESQNNVIVFLDINMPGMNGHQFLDELRQDPKLRRTIVFVVSTSDHALDRAKAYDYNVAGYFMKSNIDGLLDTVNRYAECVEFPPNVD